MKLEMFFEKFDQFADATDAVTKMRALVFTYATSGAFKLQSGDDESASNLFEKIVANFETLVRGKKIQKPKKTKPIQSEKLEPLPENWIWTRLGDAVDYGSSPKVNSTEIEESDWLLDLEDIEKTTSRLIRKKRFSDNPSKSTKTSFKRGDVLYGKLRPYLDKVLVADDAGYCTTEIIPIRTYGLVDPEYLRIALKRPSFIQYATQKSYGMNLPRLGTEDARNALFPLPPLAEQKRIAAKVDELMALCDRLEEQQQERDTRHAALARASLTRFADAPTPANLNFLFHKSYDIDPADLRKAILTLAVQGKLVPQGQSDRTVNDLLKQELLSKQLLVAQGKVRYEKPLEPIRPEEIPSQIPSNWEWCKIDRLVLSLKDDIRTGPFGSSLHKQDHRALGVPVWGIESIGKNGSFTGHNKIWVDETKAKKLASFTAKSGDIIVSRSGTVGELCRLPDTVPDGLISTNLMKISLNHRVINPDYFCLLFKGAMSINAQLSMLCSGSTRLFLTQKILTRLLFPVPPITEQGRIVAKVNQLIVLVDDLERQLIASSAAAKNILEALVAELTATGAPSPIGTPTQ